MSGKPKNPHGLDEDDETVSANENGDPHFVGFAGQYYDVFPIGDAVVLDSGDGNFAIHGRHEGHWSSLTALAFKSLIVPEKEGAKDDHFILEYYCNTRKFWKTHKNQRTEVVLKEAPSKEGIYIRTPNISILGNKEKFDIEFHDLGSKVGVKNCGGHWLCFSLSIPKKMAEKCKPSLLGNLYGDHGRIIPAVGLFEKQEVVRESPLQKNPPIIDREKLMRDPQFVKLVEGIRDERRIRNLMFDYQVFPAHIRDEALVHDVSFVKGEIIKEEENKKRMEMTLRLSNLNVDSQSVERPASSIERAEITPSRTPLDVCELLSSEYESFSWNVFAPVKNATFKGRSLSEDQLNQRAFYFGLEARPVYIRCPLIDSGGFTVDTHIKVNALLESIQRYYNEKLVYKRDPGFERFFDFENLQLTYWSLNSREKLVFLLNLKK